MTNINLTYHESYGYVTRQALVAIRRYNVSQSDYDGILADLGLDWHSGNGFTQGEWSEVIDYILENSTSGIFRPQFP